MHNNENTIKGVKCVVKTCHYNMDGDKCTADSIHILPKNASTMEETDCGTYESSTMK